ncbi:MAG: 16S rRNA (cytidine(1402)-2'-O)-methyltransferase [Candidatus Margulisbacteria bacterium]|nr:16S rRNA (cytidine(1402)-2'-O)-methyltransferase [Candidatus Margulisiibacteriota bacterium]MBU1021054.1 16S rRNA (cytidine(1402)-2'-O)-methyltransferase [Candidatus Margulisiibacteriota bacterium]MBU1729729.1 16S rRNA (cytidine(1402)-2'-O)-methyltransferase [Candidatus Margulisiibacteriota bacterium]MBU1955994.1 16S rRNA (cytidine(1402)-2'-O)-methyltransferase [Candidatus Margulisiibacteriota bacterium]
MGTLFVCATPIGNLSDASPRLLETLAAVDLIVSEDTRQIQKLLNKFSIKAHAISYHKFNIQQKTAFILDVLKQGKKVALVSDSGTPVISDPGYELVNQALSKKIKVEPIPGPCAATAALSVSGMPADKFVFEGFLPKKPTERRSRLKTLSIEERTIVFYEAPHRILKALGDILLNFGDREVSVIREITKKFEEIIKGKLSKVIHHFKEAEPRGEFVVVVKGLETRDKRPETKKEIEEDALIEELIKTDLSKKDISKIVAKVFDVSKNDVYKKLI